MALDSVLARPYAVGARIVPGSALGGCYPISRNSLTHASASHGIIGASGRSPIRNDEEKATHGMVEPITEQRRSSRVIGSFDPGKSDP
jgi:hypothetical protein